MPGEKKEGKKGKKKRRKGKRKKKRKGKKKKTMGALLKGLGSHGGGDSWVRGVQSIWGVQLMHIISLCMFNKVLILILMFQLNCIMSTIICNTAVSACRKRARRGGPRISGCGGLGFALHGPGDAFLSPLPTSRKFIIRAK